MLIDIKDSTVILDGNSFFSLYEAFDIGGAVVIGCQGDFQIIKIEDQPRKIVTTHSYIEKRIEEGLVSTPFNTYLLGD